MSNAIAEQYKHVVYITKISCRVAIANLDQEQIKLKRKINSMKETKQEYEANVMPYISNASSQMVEQVEKIIREARELLVENYNGATIGVRETKDNLNGIIKSIGSSKNRIKNLQTQVKANEAHIDELISKYQEEEKEVIKERTRASNSLTILSSKPDLFF